MDEGQTAEATRGMLQADWSSHGSKGDAVSCLGQLFVVERLMNPSVRLEPSTPRSS